MARPTKEELAKREAAKKRVEELIGDIKIDDKQIVQVADKLDKIESPKDGGKGNAWLEKEMARLSAKNSELEDQIVKAKEDYNKLLNSSKVSTESVSDGSVEAGVKKIFDELDYNFKVKNYTQVNIKILLEKFVGTFKFLQKKR